MSKKERFTGGDNLQGLHKLYHEAMMQNELRDGKGGYELSYAGKGESGPSFGGNQMDISTNKNARELFRSIILNARGNNGQSYFNKYEDKISLINYPNISSKSDIKFEENIIAGSNYTKLTFSNDTGLVLLGFQVENLSGENFVFYQE